MLERYPLFETQDLDLSQQIHAMRGLDLRLRGGWRSGDMMLSRANALETAVLDLYAYFYSRPVTLNATSTNPHYWIAAPVRPGGARVEARIDRLASPDQDDPLRIEGAQSMVGLRLEGGAVQQFAERYLGEELPEKLRFTPVGERPTAADAYIASQLELRVKRAARGALDIEDEYAGQRLLEKIVEALLVFHGHRHKALVRCAGLAPAPRDVKKALDYIHAHADRRPGVADLAEVAGVPGRTLGAHFHRFVGASPVEYVRRVRMQNVRAALLKAGDGGVAEAAATQGFTHLGRFAGDYAKAFGETPRETLRRRPTPRPRIAAAKLH